MHITRLTLTNFRNYRHLDLALAPGVSVFYGNNAQGKSNLLEAIYLLAIAKSPRVHSERELVNWQAFQENGYALINAEAQRSDGPLNLRVGLQCVSPIDGDGQGYAQKRIRVNGIPWLASKLVGQLNVVLFSAEDIDLVKGAPSRRRRYLDVLLSQVDGGYLRALQRYQRALTQRNHLLRLLRDRQAHSDEILFWDQTISRDGGIILEFRLRMVDRLAPLANQAFRHLTNSTEELRISYQSAVPLGHGRDAATLAQLMNQALVSNRNREVAAGMTLIGPHRDDLCCDLGHVNLSVYASRGEARATALALCMAEVRFLEEMQGETPLLLLDDVLSELDADRRNLVMAAASDCEQTLVTATDLGMFDKDSIVNARLFHVDEGSITLV